MQYFVFEPIMFGMPFYLFGIASFVLGAIVGSFINVLVLRYGTGKSISRGRSVCLACSTQISNIDLFPIVSFILLSGRCRSCKSKLSFQYPLVEILNGILFLGAYFLVEDLLWKDFTQGLLIFLAFAVVSSLLLSILVYDIKHKIIPNGLAFSLAIVSIPFLFLNLSPLSFGLPSLWHILAAPIVAFPLFLLWLVSRGSWMGLGDAKLVWSFGWLVGLSGGFSAVILGFWLGALISIFILLLQNAKSGFTNIRKLHMKSEIPFAPFLIAGAFIVLFFGLDLFSLIV